jgi:hypothetical protein
MTLRSALVLAPLLVSACVTTGPGPRCPGSNDVCLSGMDCVPDRERGCQVCQCRRTDEPTPPPAAAGKAYPEGTPSRLPPKDR